MEHHIVAVLWWRIRSGRISGQPSALVTGQTAKDTFDRIEFTS
jgi:hypothetical protein